MPFFFLLAAAFLHVHKHVSMSSWVWPVFLVHISCFIKVFKDMGVKAIVVGEHNMWAYFQIRDYRLLGFNVLLWIQQLAISSNASPSFYIPATPSSGMVFLKRMLLSIFTSDYRVEGLVSLLRRDFFLNDKNIQFKHFCVERMYISLCLKKKKGRAGRGLVGWLEKITWKFGPIPSQFISSSPSFPLFLSPSPSGFQKCVSRCLSPCL